jgi:hypothetical protein
MASRSRPAPMTPGDTGSANVSGFEPAELVCERWRSKLTSQRRAHHDQRACAACAGRPSRPMVPGFDDQVAALRRVEGRSIRNDYQFAMSGMPELRPACKCTAGKTNEPPTEKGKSHEHRTESNSACVLAGRTVRYSCAASMAALVAHPRGRNDDHTLS